ncbi:MAG: dTDP-4-dehydrorhamnose 3,5-epimerase family protein [Magnetococcus sp. YQC-9]
MAIRVTGSELSGVLWIEPAVYGDARGFFSESFNRRDFLAGTGIDVVFEHESQYQGVRGRRLGWSRVSLAGAGWLWRVTDGELFVAVRDARSDGMTQGGWVQGYLDANRMGQIWIPPGMVFVFQVVSEKAEWIGKCTRETGALNLVSLSGGDEEWAIDWPVPVMLG